MRRRGSGRTGHVRYRFFTAYAPPATFLDHLASLFPEVDMDLTFEVELLGEGAASWSGGRQVDYRARPY